MKKFLALVLIISAASSNISAGWMYPVDWASNWTVLRWFKRTPVKSTSRVPVRTKSPQFSYSSKINSAVKSMSQVPMNAAIATKNTIANHPRISIAAAVAATLIAADQTARTYSKWYRENAAVNFSFGEKRLQKQAKAQAAKPRPKTK